ncbi:MEKHLA domain-containing protein [Cognatishimia sp. SS12]|uniref:MEKHLA domain-containing protein n=1 Tax=Cognatishimia sp. SS12 TaxID=2979465 RepID=UPI00232B9830|nr:MEKHLA domain-containing protein [Cognatishimia sp. SS12]MDC0737326.1 MEKHLA domain-containing protein [Cognatishimia sp. SS12]
MLQPAPENDYHPAFSATLLRSFAACLGRPLLRPATAQALYEAPFPVLAHNTADDPILTYGNRAAQQLWELDWAALRQLPSRLTAEPGQRAERAAMFDAMRQNGFADDYSGIRISATGQRFRIKNAIIWTLTNAAGVKIGEAATFKDYELL